jgi:hypothetical protein
MNVLKWMFSGWINVRPQQRERSLATVAVVVLFLGFAYGQEQAAVGKTPAKYVGPEACKTCHEDIYNNFDKSPHWKTTNGNTLFLNPNAPVGPLQYNYQKSYAGFIFDLAKGFAFKTMWTYYGYNPQSISNLPGLAPIGSQEFTANNVTLALRYSF